MTITSKGFASQLSAGPPVGHARISGIGGYRPRRVVPNAELVERINSSDEWIRERSGIIERRWAGEGESVIDMSELAAAPALEMAEVEAADIDVVIVATVSWPYQTPAASPMLAERLGTKGAAFDISAACAGYCHGIGLASDMVRTGNARHVLVVGVERLTDFTDKDDRGTSFIFADGAGAAVVSPSDTPGVGPTIWGSDGAQWDAISQKDSWIDVHENNLGWPAIGMAGQTVFRWAVWGWRRSPRRRWRPLASPPTSSTPSCRTRPTSASSTPWSSSSGCPRTSPSPATSPTPATPRRPRSRWPWSG